MYGKKESQPVLEPEVANNPDLQEALLDEDSLQYAEYVKKRSYKPEYDFMRPGKIKDWRITKT